MLECKVDHRVYDRRVAGTMVVLGDGMASGVMTAAQKAAKYARSHHRHKKRTGKLTSPEHLFARMERVTRTGSKAALVNTARYARFVEYPTRPHVIRPKAGHGTIGPLRRGQSRRDITDIGTHRVALRWYVNGRPVFARKVMHPGTPGFPFMRPALKVADRAFRHHFQEVTVARLKRLWRTR